MSNPPRVYWDANAWIAYIKKEMPGPDNFFKEPRFEMCRTVLARADNEDLEIVTSALTVAEVCKGDLKASSPALNLPAFFDQRYILVVNVDKQIGLKAQALQMAGLASLRPADAVHLASALVHNVPVLHTFDTDLLKHDARLEMNNGNTLKICHPSANDDGQGDLLLRPLT